MAIVEGTSSSTMKTERGNKLLFNSVGIVVTLGAYGFLQEQVMTTPYGGEFFNDTVFLVFCNRLIGFVYAALAITARGDTFGCVAPSWKYFVVSMANVTAATCQYEALKWVTMPVQLLGKSFRQVPVMAWGIVISGKTYSLFDWALAGVITWGVSQFLMFGPIGTPRGTISHSSGYGLLLLAAFLVCDSFTSTMQENLFRVDKTSKYNQMLYVNLCSLLISFAALLAVGSLFNSLAFCFVHPLLLTQAMLLSFAAVSSQCFIYSQVEEFGAVTLAATLNFRQVVSTLFSYASFGHPISVLQGFSLLLVFGALFYKSRAALREDETIREKDPLLHAGAHDRGNTSGETDALLPEVIATDVPRGAVIGAVVVAQAVAAAAEATGLAQSCRGAGTGADALPA